MAGSRIGLLVGNEISFPDAFEDLIDFLAPDLAAADLPLAVERISLGPFRTDLAARPDLLIDRIGHWHTLAREWAKTAVLAGAYPLNHPFQFQAMEKTTGYAAMRRLGLEIPATAAIPPKDQGQIPPGVAERYHLRFRLEEVGAGLGWPVYLKPFDGGGWVGVTRCADADQLRRDYDASGRRVMLAQAGVEGGLLVRCIAIGPQVLAIPYAPEKPLHERYLLEAPRLAPPDLAELGRISRLVSAFFGLEWNSVEVIMKEGRFHPIDFWNAIPDTAISSLHFYFPPVLTALVAWVAYCLASGRRFRFDTGIDAFLERAAAGGDPGGLARDLDGLAARRLDRERFRDFLATRLGFLEGRAREYFASRRFERVVAREVFRTYPLHEREDFLARYCTAARRWCATGVMPAA